jgi:dTDP-3-amino-2,3,6-trideoxy-4-keto-D-glucose/dTDP-3-amino-3,4,6-trideoxy-alpha-D-glucose/dTDP-2,6-dideoxy-D-kanosamine transaminase
MLLINDLHRHNLEIMDELKKTTISVLESGWYILGTQVKEFEKEFAAFCQTAHCISVANGTDALELSLRAIGIKQNDTVMTVANAGGYSTAAILGVGAMPRYVEIDHHTLMISVDHLEKMIRDEKPSAVIITHLYGQAAPMDKILSITSQYGIPVIEDCAQAHGATLNGRKVGAMGALGCFSFYPSKNLGALGDAGAIITNDSELDARVRGLRQYGWHNKYEATLSGGRNSRLDELQAAILRLKLTHLDKWNQRRYEISHQYKEGIQHPSITITPMEKGNFVGHLFVIRTPERDKLRQHLKENAIMSEIHYPTPDYLQPTLKDLFAGTSLPVTEKASAEILTLPCFPEMTDDEIHKVIHCVNNWV